MEEAFTVEEYKHTHTQTHTHTHTHTHTPATNVNVKCKQKYAESTGQLINLRTHQIFKGMEFTSQEEQLIKLLYTGNKVVNLLEYAENLEIPHTITLVVMHCGTNNIEANTSNDNANGLLFCLFDQKRNSITNIYTSRLPPHEKPT